MKIKQITLPVKIISVQVFFLMLHFLYDWMPGKISYMFSGVNESVYQHMKIAFFSYVVFVLIEYLIIRKSIKRLDQHLYARLFSASYLPLVVMVIYLVSPLLFGQLEHVVFEIVFANFALLAAIYFTLVIEDHIQKVSPSFAFRITTIMFFGFSLAEYIGFTYKIPWFDIFAVPPGY